MKRFSTIILLISLFAISGFGQQFLPFQSEWKGDKCVDLSFPVIVPDSLMDSDYAVWYTPYVYGEQGDTLELSPVVFRGKRNRRYVERARFYQDAPVASCQECGLKDTLQYTAQLSTATAPWLLRGRIVVDTKVEQEGCCNLYEVPDAHIGHFAYIPPFVPYVIPVEDNTGKAGELKKQNPVLAHISDYRPYDNTRILRKEKDMLFVNFPLDKTILLHDFRQNGPTLDKIVSITRDILADTTSTVKLIQIVGLASAEGPVQRNEALAGGRALALKQYIQERVQVPDGLFELCNGGEGWSELRDQINDSEFEGKAELLDIIDHTADPNVRERKVKSLRGGVPYRYLKDHILQDQRNSGYLRIYYDYVPDTNAKVINEASEWLRKEEYGQALQLLQTVRHDERAWNALAVALYMTGQEAESLEYMRKAAAQGNAEAQHNLQQYEAIQKAREAAN